MAQKNRVSFLGTHLITFTLGVLTSGFVTFALISPNENSYANIDSTYTQLSESKALPSEQYSLDTKAELEKRQAQRVNTSKINLIAEENDAENIHSSREENLSPNIKERLNENSTKALNIDEVREKARKQAQQIFKNSVISIDPDKASMMDRGINDNTNLDERALTYQRLLQDFLDANLAEPHYLQDLRCNENLCRIAAISAEPDDLQSILLTMTNESWYNSLIFKSPNTADTDFHIYYLPFIANS